MPPSSPAYTVIHPIYALFLLTLEPLTALSGFIAAALFPTLYLQLTHAPSAPPHTTLPDTSSLALDASSLFTDVSASLFGASHPHLPGNPPLATHTALRQLANMYLLFALNEALVLRVAAKVLPSLKGKSVAGPAKGGAAEVKTPKRGRGRPSLAETRARQEAEKHMNQDGESKSVAVAAAAASGWECLVPVHVAVDVRVWRAVLTVLLIADVGHLWSVAGLGSGVYWRFWEWNSMAFGNVGIVYMGMATRIAFLCGVGVGAPVAVL